LYKNLALLFILSGNATALEYYNDTLYIAIEDDENKGILQRISAGEIESLADNENQFTDTNQTILNSLYSSDSVINAMEVFDDILFMGLQNGTLLSFNGASVSVEYDEYLDIKNINEIRTDENLLYIFFTNFTEITVMNEDNEGNHIFNMVDMGN